MKVYKIIYLQRIDMQVCNYINSLSIANTTIPFIYSMKFKMSISPKVLKYILFRASNRIGHPFKIFLMLINL